MRISYYKFLDLLSKDTITLENDIRISYILTIFDFIACNLKLKEDYTDAGIQEFTGELNGNGHTIVMFSSLYNTIESNGTVKNLTIENTIFFGRAFVCDVNNGTVENVTVKTDFNYSTSNVGGIVNENNGTLCNCTFIGRIIIRNGNYIPEPTASGICGINYGLIKDCSVKNSVITGIHQIGGITSANRNRLENCKVINSEIHGFYSSGGVTGSNFESISGCQIKNTSVLPSRYSQGKKIGGICGVNKNNGVIKKCTVVSGFIKGSTNIGGICGINKDQIKSNEVEEDVKVQGVSGVGTLCGKCEESGAILKSFSNGTVTSENEAIGGIVGVLTGAAICKSVVFNGKSSSAALIGHIESKNVKVLNCHFTKGNKIKLINENNCTTSIDVYRDTDLRKAVVLTKI